jgi:hypothetical protein
VISKTIPNRAPSKIYLPLLLAFIFAEENCSNYLLNLFNNQPYSHAFIFYVGFMLLSIIASPIQSGYSDFNCRRKSLIISLSCSLISLFFAFLSVQTSLSVFLVLAILMKAGLGNTLPLSWAGIADTQTKYYRFSFGLSTAAMALGDFFLDVSRKIFNQNIFSIILILIFILLIYLCCKEFYDIRKNDSRVQENKKSIPQKGLIFSEIKSMAKNFLSKKHIRNALLAFFLWEVSFYSALVVDLDLRLKPFKDLSLVILTGYLLGICVLKYLKNKNDDEMIKTGYIISLISVAPIFIFKSFFDIRPLMLVGYFFYSMGAVFLAPSLFSLIAKERKPHEQGKIYGLIDSTDLIAFLIASIIALIYHRWQANTIVLFLCSFIAILISWLPYARFKRTRPTINQQ